MALPGAQPLSRSPSRAAGRRGPHTHVPCEEYVLFTASPGRNRMSCASPPGSGHPTRKRDHGVTGLGARSCRPEGTAAEVEGAPSHSLPGSARSRAGCPVLPLADLTSAACAPRARCPAGKHRWELSLFLPRLGAGQAPGFFLPEGAGRSQGSWPLTEACPPPHRCAPSEVPLGRPVLPPEPLESWQEALGCRQGCWLGLEADAGTAQGVPLLSSSVMCILHVRHREGVKGRWQ